MTIGQIMGPWGDGFRGELAAQEERLFLWIPVALSLGILAYFIWPVEPHITFSLILLAVLMPALAVAWYRQHDHGVALFLYLLLFAIVLMVAGFSASMVAAQRFGTPMLSKQIKITDVSGVIESIDPQGQGRGSKVVLSDLEIGKLLPDQTPRKIRLTFKKDGGLEPGARIAFRANLSPPSGPVLPGAYDFRRHLFFEGIGAVGFSYDAPAIIAPPEKGHIAVFFEDLRQHIQEQIAGQVSPTSEGLMTALITGQRGGIADEDDEAMRESGLAHLISISGTHISMAALTLFFFSRLLMALSPWMALHWPIKKIAAIIALCGAVSYTFLAGAEVPAIRAMLMTALVLIAIILDRSPFSLRLIAFAALCVLILQPQSLVGVSFQMSFAAVAALICFYESTERFWKQHYHGAGWIKKAALYFIGILITSLIAGGMTGLFGLYHFQQFAVYGVLANMIAVPITGFIIMPAIILALILMPFGLHGFALTIMEWGSIWILAVAHWAAGLEGAVLHVHQWPVITLCLIAAGIVLFLLWRGWRGKICAAVCVMVGLLIGALSPMPDVMIAHGGGVMGVRDGSDLFVTQRRGDRFTQQNWMRLMGRDGEKPLLLSKDAAFAACDFHGCRMEIKNKKLAIVYDPMAVQEDCQWADVMIAHIPARGCKGPVIIDLFDMKRDGAIGVYLNRTVMIERAGDLSQGRPWGL